MLRLAERRMPPFQQPRRQPGERSWTTDRSSLMTVTRDSLARTQEFPPLKGDDGQKSHWAGIVQN